MEPGMDVPKTVYLPIAWFQSTMIMLLRCSYTLLAAVVFG